MCVWKRESACSGDGLTPFFKSVGSRGGDFSAWFSEVGIVPAL